MLNEKEGKERQQERRVAACKARPVKKGRKEGRKGIRGKV
jgi:hypothetical protein